MHEQGEDEKEAVSGPPHSTTRNCCRPVAVGLDDVEGSMTGYTFIETDCDPGVFDEGSCSDRDWGRVELWRFAHRENRLPRQYGFTLFSLKYNLNATVDEGNKLT